MAAMAPALLLVLAAALLVLLPAAAATGVFQVRRKFAAGGTGEGANISHHRAHDAARHGRLLDAVDLPLGGLGLPTSSGLYYTEIRIGTPPKRYYVQVDTGSDILWVNCISCDRCPKKSGLGIDLTLYDPKGSSSGEPVTCDQGFCAATYGGKLPGCTPNIPCEYSVMYGDGSSTTGFFVTDALEYDQVSGNGQTRPANVSVTFGGYPPPSQTERGSRKKQRSYKRPQLERNQGRSDSSNIPLSQRRTKEATVPHKLPKRLTRKPTSMIGHF